MSQASRTDYFIWKGMVDRCHKKYATSYKWYGKKGISVCKRWRKYKNFLADMGKRPSVKHSIDRIDSSRDYKPSNCRWVLWSVQANNNNRNKNIEFNGIKLSTTQWAAKINLNKGTLFTRIRNGWPIEKALTEPVCTKFTKRRGSKK